MKAIKTTAQVILVSIACLFLLLIGSCTFQAIVAGPKHAETGPVRMGWIPEEAKNIDYIEPIPFAPADYAAFNISQAGYLRWVEEWQQRKPELPRPELGEFNGYVLDFQLGKPRFVTIPRALRSSHLIEDRAIELVFDLDAQRAYYHRSHR